MILRLAALILLTAVSLIQTAEDPHLISLTEVEPGDNVTFYCSVSEKDTLLYWYKQSLGHTVQIVAVGNVGKITVSEQFKESRFTVAKEEGLYVLIIRNVSKEDEATYFCHKGTVLSQTSANGTFLAVNENNRQKSVYVSQSPEKASVPLGDTLTLQCSLLYKNTAENTDQCPDEHCVYWFRAASAGFHPGFVSTHRNRSDERVERSCVYSLSKTIQDSSDTGAYYCAVVTCGEILFGEGTNVETRSKLDSVVLVLGPLLACCVTVISILIFYINRRRLCKHCKGRFIILYFLFQLKSSSTQKHVNEGEEKAVNYVALDFSTRKVKRGNKKSSEYSLSLIQTAEDPHLISLTEVEPGDNVTFYCSVSEKDTLLYWYKQSLGHTVQIVAVGNIGKITVSEQFKESRFTVAKEEGLYVLIIRNVSKEDEATYFCHKGTVLSQTSANGTFLAVTENNRQKSVYVSQSPEKASVPLGDTLTLQCSLLYKNTAENTDQCPDEHCVYWFRAASAGFHPGFVSTHRNRSDERVERSCVYSLSKTIQDSSDTGAYYCAVVTCGEILFGEGTNVETRSKLDSVVLVLGPLLACCVTVISILIFYINRRRLCKHCKDISCERQDCCTTMILRLAALILLTAVSLIQTAEDPHLISLTEVEPGDNVTFYCSVSEKDTLLYWYKQSLGHTVQIVAVGNIGKITVSEQFKESRFTVAKEEGLYVLIIRNVSKEDEATYFCHKGTVLSQTSANGTFLAVNENNRQKSVYVSQSPEKASVPLGDTLTLQCSLLYKNTAENTDQCPDEHCVYWFRAASAGFHPGFVSTHRNRSDERVERSCVYSLSKTIQDSSDTGAYYCAVVTCGEILFGEGTNVETRPKLDSVVLVLGPLLACCVTVISILIFYINRRRLCKHCKGASHNLRHDKSTVDQSDNLDGEEKAVNYVALDFSTRKVKRGNKKSSEYSLCVSTQCVYSAVRSDYHTQQQSSL
ncbi:hypothetical protein PAMP_023130 [Pampus punctatissimus]